jgi:hypothetical protein
LIAGTSIFSRYTKKVKPEQQRGVSVASFQFGESHKDGFKLVLFSEYDKFQAAWGGDGEGVHRARND